MEARFQEKHSPAQDLPTSAFVVPTTCSTKALSQKCASAECRKLQLFMVCRSYLSVFVWIRTPAGCTTTPLPVTSCNKQLLPEHDLAVLFKLLRTLRSTYSFTQKYLVQHPLERILRIIFLLLDWIYRSFSIRMVRLDSLVWPAYCASKKECNICI